MVSDTWNIIIIGKKRKIKGRGVSLDIYTERYIIN